MSNIQAGSVLGLKQISYAVMRARVIARRHARSSRSSPGRPGKGHDCSVLTDPEALLAGVREAADPAEIEGWPCPIRFEALPAPHERPVLPPDEAAVYAFTLSTAAGHSALCGPGTVLMVAKLARTKGSGSRTRPTMGPTIPPPSLEACWPTHPVALVGNQPPR